MLSFKVNELVTSLCKKELVIKLKEIFDYFTNKGDYDIFCEIIEIVGEEIVANNSDNCSIRSVI